MRAVLLVLVVSAGCSQSETASGAPVEDAGQTARTQKPTAPAEIPEEPAQPAVADLRVPDGVAELSSASIEQPRNRKSQRINARALELHNQQKFDEAIELYKEALSLDPGNVLARYNLSCAYNLSGRPDDGLAILKQFFDTGCAECKDRLARASEDAEWHDQWDDPRFVELVAVAADPDRDPRWWLAADPCPDGARVRGASPPDGDELWCARPSGTRHGAATLWKDGRILEQGEYRDGRREGPWLIFAEDGSLRESGDFRRGRKDGPWSSWAPSGEQIADGRYKSGKKHGTWTMFSAAGAVDRTETWRNGRQAD